MRTLTAVPAELLDVASRQAGLVDAAQCDAHGVTAHRRGRLVAQRRWSRPTRGVFDTTPPVGATPPGRDLTTAHDHRRTRAAWLALLAYGPDAIAVGPCALVLLGIQGVGADVVPQVALPGARASVSRDGIALRQFDDGMTVTRVGGRLVATPCWALAQAVPEMRRRRAVAVMDSAQHLGLLDADGLARAHDLARGRRGVARTHSWWALSDGRAESPLETFGRLECADAGIPPDALQVQVHDDGRFLGRGDIGWRLPGDRWLIAEMDGVDVHSEPGALLRDRERQNDLVGCGAVDLLRFTGRDLAAGPGLGPGLGTSRRAGPATRGRMTTVVRRHLLRTGAYSPSSTTLMSR
ncbi:hypothetical protein [Oerskovia flava]|uniref:hypothetical protein n=1 Tax=Oerskovia flava TaxID=2986422 RepID=UPI002240DC76|nr:hypothetical protein [Oerskovia sp. JB1-3-2]